MLCDKDRKMTSSVHSSSGVEEEVAIEDGNQEIIALRKSNCDNKGIPPKRLGYTVNINTIIEPNSWGNVLELPDGYENKWIIAAKGEIILYVNIKFGLCVILPSGKRAISCKWVFKVKLDGDCKVKSYKARLVAREFSQCYGEDYNVTFAPVI